jgi:hypothetical protein
LYNTAEEKCYSKDFLILNSLENISHIGDTYKREFGTGQHILLTIEKVAFIMAVIKDFYIFIGKL